MKKNSFQYVEMFFALLYVVRIVEVLAQCNKVNQEVKDNRREDVEDQNPYTTSNIGAQVASDPSEIVGLDGYDAAERGHVSLDIGCSRIPQGIFMHSKMLNFNELTHVDAELNTLSYC